MSLKIQWILDLHKNCRNPTTFGFELSHIPICDNNGVYKEVVTGRSVTGLSVQTTKY